MKYAVVFFFVLGLWSSGHGQVSTNVNADPVSGGLYQFHPQLSVTDPSPAQYTWLWWFGDGNFCFYRTPEHTFDTIGQINARVIPTIGYGSSGPPPMADTTLTVNGTGQNSGRVLDPNRQLLVQHYRNAVPQDSMYVIMTYRRDFADSIGPAILTLTYDPDLLTFPPNPATSYTPNREVLTASHGTLSWQINFSNLPVGEERSILVPFWVSPTAEERIGDRIELSGRFQFEGGGTPHQQSMFLPIRGSHDPNAMSPSITEDPDCNVGGEEITYTVEFQNTGDIATKYIRLECFLDEALDLSTLDLNDITYKHTLTAQNNPPNGSRVMGQGQGNMQAWQHLYTDSNKLVLEIHNIELAGMGDPTILDSEMTKGWAKFSVKVKPHYTIGRPIKCYTDIYFDHHPEITTNDAITTCPEPKLVISHHGWPLWVWCLISLLILLLIILLIMWSKRTRKKWSS